jgi:uncharacterized protein involved in outer membrane biogenesis
LPRNPWLRRLSIVLAIGVGFVIAFVAFLLLIQPILNLSPFKGLLAAQLSGLAGVPVTLEELYLKTSLEPRVEIRELQVADLAGVGTAQLQIELIPLLKRNISIDSLKLDQVTVQVRPTVDLVREWLSQDDRPKSPYRVDALENLEFDRVQLNVTGDRGGDHRLVIDECDGGITRESPLKLEARGSFDDTALRFEAGGPTLEEFFNSDSTIPMEAALEVAGANLTLDGTLTRQSNPPTLALNFSLEGDALETTLAAVGIQLPPLGSFQVQGSLTHSGGPFHLTELQSRIGEAGLSGDLQLSFESEKLTLDGRLDTGRIDLGSWLDLPPPGDNQKPEVATEYRIFERPIPTEPIENALAAMNVDLDISIEGLDGLQTTVEEMKGELILQDGHLTLPYELALSGAPVRGQTTVTSSAGTLGLSLELASATFTLDQLSQDLGRGLTTGTVGHVYLSASSSGDTIGDLLNQLVLELDSGDARLLFSSPNREKKVDLVLTRLELKRGPEVPIWVELDGDLKGYPYRIELAGQDTKDWESKAPWPFTLISEALGGRTSIAGKISLEPDDFFLELELDVTGDRIGDLEPWWGVPQDADYPYEVRGSLLAKPGHWKLDLDTVRVGQTLASLTVLDPELEGAPLRLDLQAETVFLDELMYLIEPEEEEIAAEPVLTLDIPIWPEELRLPDTRANIELDEVLREAPGLADFNDVSVDLDIFESQLERIAFSARADEASCRGDLHLDWATDPPEMTLDLGGEALDLGRLVELDEIAPDLIVRAERFDLDVTAEAETLRQMLREGVTITGGAEDVYISAPSLDAEKPLELTLDQASISEAPGKPIQVRADGHLWEWPVDLQIALHNKERTGPDDDPFPVEMSLRAGDVRLKASGELVPPVTPDNLDLSFSLTADRVSSFEPFTGHRISEIGPVAASGNLAIRPDHYTLQEFSLEVSESDVHGSMSLDLASERPRLSADFSSRRIHLAEIGAHARDPDPTQSETAASAEPDSGTEEEAQESWLEKLQSSKLAELDLDLSLQSDDIYWGGETGGGGHIEIRSEKGRLAFGPFHLALADGWVDGNVLVQADSGLLDADMELLVYDVEYGPIVRSFNPEGEGSGTIDLETRLVASSAPAGELITTADGEFRFALFPRNVDTTLLNFWGAGLFSSMFRAVDPTDESILNCMVGDFSVTDGVLTADQFWFDTSRIRARGKGTIDLPQGTLDMTLHPRPKKRTFLTLATPARIKGPVEDPKVSLKKGGMVGTAFRLYMWWLTIYTQILKKPLPTDGSDVCFLPPPPETTESPTSEATQPPNR